MLSYCGHLALHNCIDSDVTMKVNDLEVDLFEQNVHMRQCDIALYRKRLGKGKVVQWYS